MWVYKGIIKLAIKGRFCQLELVAGLLAALKKTYPYLVGMVVDHVLEELECGLENN